MAMQPIAVKPVPLALQVKPVWRGKTNQAYAAERIEVRHHAAEIYARRCARELSRSILTLEMKSLIKAGERNFLTTMARDRYKVASSHVEFCVDLTIAYLFGRTK